MYIINQSEQFRSWLSKLRDTAARAKILMRVKRAELGNFGDSKSLGAGLWEMRIDFGPGYRVYYGQAGEITYLLLCGGNKSTQQGDITRARALWESITKERSK